MLGNKLEKQAGLRFIWDISLSGLLWLELSDLRVLTLCGHDS